MNRDQIMGIAKDAAGKVQQKIGEWTGNKSQQAKGAAKQIEGKVQTAVGNTEHALNIADKRTGRRQSATQRKLSPSLGVVRPPLRRESGA